MGRKKIDVDGDLLKKTIASLETKNKYDNLSALYKDVAKEMDVPASVIPLRVLEFQIPILTKPGRRGRQKGEQPFINIKNKGQKKTSPLDSPDGRRSVAWIKKNTPAKYKKLADRYPKSLRGAIKLHCLHCVDFQKAEITYCGCTECVLWIHRPYAKGINNGNNQTEAEKQIQSVDTTENG
jgi:hypothetical protein